MGPEVAGQVLAGLLVPGQVFLHRGDAAPGSALGLVFPERIGQDDGRNARAELQDLHGPPFSDLFVKGQIIGHRSPGHGRPLGVFLHLRPQPGHRPQRRLGAPVAPRHQGVDDGLAQAHQGPEAAGVHVNQARLDAAAGADVVLIVHGVVHPVLNITPLFDRPHHVPGGDEVGFDYGAQDHGHRRNGQR